MRGWIFGIMAAATIGVLGTGAMPGARGDQTNGPAAVPATQPASALDFSVKDIDGKDVQLSKYKGDVVLILNVASKCGNTPQYKDLEDLYEKDKDKGLVILGFPANNFGHQEPGTDGQIKDFCTSTYHVAFPMFSKVSVKGDDKAPLFQYLTAQKTQPKPAGDISWNFEKFVIGRDGREIARFAPKTKVTDEKVMALIDAELAKPKP